MILRKLILAASLLLVAGCTRPVGENNKPVRPVVDNVPAIEAMAYRACQERDANAGQRLQQLAADIKAGKFKFDGPVLEQVKKINTETTVAAFGDVEKALRDSFDPKLEKLNPEKVAAAVEQYGKGRERASK